MRTIKLVLVMLFSIAFAACNPGDKKPDTPTGVTATAGNGQVTINWNAVSGATSYNLYMATQTGVTKNNYSTLTGGMAHPAVTSPYVHPGLTDGTAYYFIVTAVNASGESVESAQVSATPSATAGFDGTYTGSWTSTRPGTILPSTSGTITLTVINGVVTGSGPAPTSLLSGTLSASGIITASGTFCNPSSGSPSGPITATGQITITASGGASMTGTSSSPSDGSCAASSTTWTATRATTATGVSVFNGVYTGTSLSTDGGTGAIVFTVTNGVVANAGAGHAGGTSGTGSGSGTVSESGVVTIRTTSSAGCAYTFTGQFTITASGGATATGTFSIPATSTCIGYSGNWTAGPDVPVPAL